MPVRSLTSSALRWPDAETVHRAALAWAVALAQSEPAIVAIGYFGSYARGDAGVGSDLDLVVLVRNSRSPSNGAGWPGHWNHCRYPRTCSSTRSLSGMR
jgi:hypothetical protein